GDKFVLQYELRDAYYSHGGFNRLGAPVADEENLGGGWWRQKCQNGDVWTHGSDKKFAIMFNLRSSFYRHGGTPRL
ncbi:glycosyl hydrolase, partial [Gardnerella vaginalis]